MTIKQLHIDHGAHTTYIQVMWEWSEMAATAQAMLEQPDLNDEANADVVRAELARICTHALFRDTTRMKRFLKYVVDETLAGRGDRLKGYVIGVEVFDRPDNFDPQADTIVRVQAGQLRRRLDLYYSDAGVGSPVRILVPKGRYSPVFEFRKEVTEAALVAEPDKNVVLTFPGQTEDPRPSIVMMTLDNLTPPGQGEYFADGLTAEIVNALVQFRAMRIVTLTPSVSSKMKSMSTRDIGRECQADFVLSGSVRRDNQVFRVIVNLIRSETGEHVFSRIFDRQYEPGSLFNLQEEIASYVAASVAAPFGAVNRYNRRMHDGRQASMEGYEAILRYYDLQLSPTRCDVKTLLDDVIRITEKETKFSTAWAIRGLLHTFLVTQYFPISNPAMNLTLAEAAARKAVSIDPQNALGHFALYQTYYHTGEFEAAGRNIRRALALNPNDYSMLAYYAAGLALRGKTERSLAMQSAAIRLVGRPPAWFYVPTAISDFKAGKYEDVVAWMPDDLSKAPAVFQMLGLAAKGYLGQRAECEAMVTRLESEVPNYLREAFKALPYWHMEKELWKLIQEGLKLVGIDIPS